MLSSHLLQKLLPIHIRHTITIIKTVYRLKLALEKFRQAKKLQSETLDATSLTISILNNDYSSASNIAFLLDVSEVLEDYAKKISVNNLKDSLILQNDTAQLVKDNQEFSVSVSSLIKDDVIIVRKCEKISVDGEIISGEAMINEIYSYRGKQTTRGIRWTKCLCWHHNRRRSDICCRKIYW